MPIPFSGWICGFCGIAFANERDALEHEEKEHVAKLYYEPVFENGDINIPTYISCKLARTEPNGEIKTIVEGLYKVYTSHNYETGETKEYK